MTIKIRQYHPRNWELAIAGNGLGEGSVVLASSCQTPDDMYKNALHRLDALKIEIENLRKELSNKKVNRG